MYERVGRGHRAKRCPRAFGAISRGPGAVRPADSAPWRVGHFPLCRPARRHRALTTTRPEKRSHEFPHAARTCARSHRSCSASPSCSPATACNSRCCRCAAMPRVSARSRSACIGSAYYAGFVAGCLLAPYVILRAGHIRAFAALVGARGRGRARLSAGQRGRALDRLPPGQRLLSRRLLSGDRELAQRPRHQSKRAGS